jgi:hypothetical protein
MSRAALIVASALTWNVIKGQCGNVRTNIIPASKVAMEMNARANAGRAARFKTSVMPIAAITDNLPSGLPMM